MEAVCEPIAIQSRGWIWHIWILLQLACASCAYQWLAQDGEVCPKCGEQAAVVLWVVV